MSRASRCILATTIAAALALGVAPRADADPSVWARARQPALDARAHLLSDVDAVLSKYEKAKYRLGDLTGDLGIGYLLVAQKMLEDAGVERSNDPWLLDRLAFVLQQSAQSGSRAGTSSPAEAMRRSVALLERVVNSPAAPATLRADAWDDLAIGYAQLGRHDDEIHAYDHALELQPRTEARTLLLANRAEALMATGQLLPAIAGYRAALSTIAAGSALDMLAYGVTTLWGLAVALDRAGEVDEALESIRLARTYDPADTRIDSPSWFYDVPADESWYKALGYWSGARFAQIDAAKIELYGRAVQAWEEYVARVPSSDPWVAIARARLAQCEKERDAMLGRRGRSRSHAASATR